MGLLDIWMFATGFDVIWSENVARRSQPWASDLGQRVLIHWREWRRRKDVALRRHAVDRRPLLSSSSTATQRNRTCRNASLAGGKLMSNPLHEGMFGFIGKADGAEGCSWECTLERLNEELEEEPTNVV
jgi:hypothetical protein